jgi:hypothetical protein
MLEELALQSFVFLVTSDRRSLAELSIHLATHAISLSCWVSKLLSSAEVATAIHLLTISSSTLLETSSHAATIVLLLVNHSHATSTSVLHEAFRLHKPGILYTLLIAVLPLLGLQGIPLLFWVHLIIGLSQLLVAMCKMALISQCAIFVGFIVSAPLSFVLVIDFISSHIGLLFHLVELLVHLTLVLHRHSHVHLLHLMLHHALVHIRLHAHKVRLHVVVGLHLYLIVLS